MFCANRTSAVSTALMFTSYIVDVLKESGADLVLRHPDGSFERIVMPSLRDTSDATAKHIGHSDPIAAE